MRRRRAGLEGWLLWRRLLEGLGLLAWIARELRLLLLLREALRLSRKARELLLDWASAKACRLRSQSALEASGLLERLLLAILRLARSGAVAAP